MLAAIAIALLAAPSVADAANASLRSGPGPLPGPEILYSGPARAPQLANRGAWKAKPILVSGASAYRRGEFLYQDYLYDDHGANLGSHADDPRFQAHLFSTENGTYLYPSDPVYANNAADIVEFRVRPLRRATAFRITLNSMKDPALVASTIAIGDSAQALELPHGANVSAPAELFLTVHGTEAELISAEDGAAVQPAPTASVSVRRRQIEVRVPHAAWDPGREKVRFAMGTGLWDEEADAYLIPQAARSETAPGGAGTASNPAAFFNVAFRPDEPYQDPTDVANIQSLFNDPAWWRDRQQGNALAQGEISQFSALVDFAKLEDGVRDSSAIPRRGPINRILVSHFEIAQGTDFTVSCGLLSEGTNCPGTYQGQLQPYAIYIPEGKVPRRGWGMTLLLHSLQAGYNQFSATRNQSQFGNRGRGSIVITPEARGPDGGYDGYAAVDVFEVWADVARRYRLDPGWTSIAGYSMGGFGTFTLGERFPDLFARAQPTVGADSAGMPENLRHIPVLMWNVPADELVGPGMYLPTAQALDGLGYRYELDQFAPAEHLTLAANDQYAPAAQFLGTARVVRNPAHVTYAIDPVLDYPELDYVADRAYWLSGLKLRDPAARASIDAVSHAFGTGDPEPSPTEQGAGTLEGGTFGSIAFESMKREWGPPPSAPKSDKLEITATNLAKVTVDPKRAGLSCEAEVTVESDGPLRVRLAGCGRTVSAG